MADFIDGEIGICYNAVMNGKPANLNRKDSFMKKFILVLLAVMLALTSVISAASAASLPKKIEVRLPVKAGGTTNVEEFIAAVNAKNGECCRR